METREAPASRLPVGVWALAGAKVALHLVTTRLWHHRDELYFISAAKRLDWSYVDFQPVTPLLVRAEREIFGESLLGLRLIPALAGAAMVLLGALIARELGGDRRAQIGAAFALLVIPLFVGTHTAVNTLSFEIPAFMLVAFLFARLLRTRDERLWLAVGAAAGLAMLVKFTALGYLFAVGVAVIATDLRRYLRRAWIWAGAALAAVIVAPSVVWQVAHGLPVLEFVSNQGSGGAVLGLRGRAGYLASLLILPGPVGLFVWIPGLRALWRDRVYRPLGIAVGVALAAFFVAAGKGYYAGPGIAVAVSAGAVAVARWSDARRKALAIALAVNLAIPAVLVLPLVPISWLRASSDLSDATELGERLGWDDFARTIARVADDLEPDERARVVVVGDNYTLPSAVELYRDRYDLPPAVSGHNSAYLWWPDLEADHVAITVGFEADELRPLYETFEQVATVTNRFGVENYEWGKPIHVARGPLVSPEELRERIKVFTA